MRNSKSEELKGRQREETKCRVQRDTKEVVLRKREKRRNRKTVKVKGPLFFVAVFRGEKVYVSQVEILPQSLYLAHVEYWFSCLFYSDR